MLAGVGAYVIWGLFPLYWPLLEPAGPLEILANRCLWSLFVVAGALAVRRSWGFLPLLLADRRRMRTLAAAAAAIAVNWGFYVYGVNSGQVVETALGYFINPLITVLLGVVVLRERLTRLQAVALGLATLAVVIITFGYGRLPWIALVLAFSFSCYGLLKKTVDVGALHGMGVETALLSAPAGLTVGVLELTGRGTFGDGAGHSLLLVAAGAVTALPLVLFAAAAPRLPMTTLGVLQYVTPTLQLGVGVLVRHEPLPPTRLAGFVLVWCALALFTAGSLREHRERRQHPARIAAVRPRPEPTV
jgi:chloramphenicol-sensitive protein RarD